jgi:hypothetical protein
MYDEDDITDEQLAAAEKDLAIMFEAIEKVITGASSIQDKRDAIAHCMTVLGKSAAILAVQNGLSMEGFLYGMQMSYLVTKGVDLDEDNLTSGHIVH